MSIEIWWLIVWIALSFVALVSTAGSLFLVALLLIGKYVK